eukprot:SAG31_NODE_22971_length_514_cov_0.783133_1_plen_46_part_01
MTDCIGILYSDSEFMDLTGFLILAPPVPTPSDFRRYGYYPYLHPSQ